MQRRKIPAIRGGILVAAVLAALGMAAATPARAAGDEEVKGWYLTLDAALTQPNGLEQQYAITSTGLPGSGDFAGKRLILDNDSDFTGAIKFGYGFGSGLGSGRDSFFPSRSATFSMMLSPSEGLPIDGRPATTYSCPFWRPDSMSSSS